MNKDIYYNGIGITNQVWFNKAAKGKIFYEQDDEQDEQSPRYSYSSRKRDYQTYQSIQ